MLIRAETQGSSLQNCVGYSIFDSVLFLSLCFFIQQKRIDSLTPERNSFQNKNDSKDVHSFAPTPPIFKLKQEV